MMATSSSQLALPKHEPWECRAESIRHRDGQQCRRCGIDSDDHRGELHVHHITPRHDRPPACGRDHPYNLVALCKGCHKWMEYRDVGRQLDELGVDDRSSLGGLADANGLRPVDRRILSFMADGRVTPAYVRQRLIEDGEYSRGYVQQRLARFEEHDHTENLLGVGLYGLVDDPREEQSPDERPDRNND